MKMSARNIRDARDLALEKKNDSDFLQTRLKGPTRVSERPATTPRFYHTGRHMSTAPTDPPHRDFGSRLLRIGWFLFPFFCKRKSQFLYGQGNSLKLSWTLMMTRP